MNENIMNGAIKLPRFLSSDASDLILRLLKRNPMERIGAGPEGAAEIKAHPFFDSLDWDEIQSKKKNVLFKKRKTVKRTAIPIDGYIEAIGDCDENRFDNWSFIRQN